MRLFVQDGFIYIAVEHSEKDVIERAVWCVLVKNSYYFVIFIQSGEVQKSQKVRKKDGREDGGRVGNTCPRTTTFPKYVVFQNFRYFFVPK